MIQAEQFVQAARRRGYTWYAGVPCSFLTSFINHVIGSEDLTYISSANEGDALAAAAGAAIGGRGAVAMMQNSGLGNAVSPLTSLTYVFRIPVLLIVTWRGEPTLQDEPQHELMGRITQTLLDAMEVPWEYFPTEPEAVEPTLERAGAYMDREQRPYALIMRKASVASQALIPAMPARERAPGPAPRADGLLRRAPGARPSRAAVLRRIVELTPQAETVIIASTGYTGRELFALADRPNQLYMVGSMGCASSLGLGLSLARRDRRIVVVDGDGAALMRMGNLATLGAYGEDNLIHIVLDNEAHDSTGGQATVSKGVSFAGVAHACGYRTTLESDDLGLLDALFADAPGPRFGHLKIRCGTAPKLPRPDLTPVQVRRRLVDHIRSADPQGRP